MIIHGQSKTLPHTKYILINLSRRASEIAVLHLRNPSISSPPPHSVESSTSHRKYSVRVTKLRLCKFMEHCSFYPYQSVCTLVWVCDDYNTPNQALPCSPGLVAAMLGGRRLQSSTSVGPLLAQLRHQYDFEEFCLCDNNHIKIALRRLSSGCTPFYDLKSCMNSMTYIISWQVYNGKRRHDHRDIRRNLSSMAYIQGLYLANILALRML